MAEDMVDSDVVVVGGGVAGLSTAFMLRQRGYSVLVLEAGGAAGGRVQTRRADGFVLDTGASFLLQGCRETLRLVDELGIAGRVEKVRLPSALWLDGRALVQPRHEAGLLTFPGLSWGARAAASKIVWSLVRHARSYDLDAPERAPTAHQTVAEFAGVAPELLDKAFDPLSCVFVASESTRVGVSPLLNLWIAARGSAWVFTFGGGMDTLPRALQEHVEVRLGSQVVAVQDGVHPRVDLADGSALTCRACVLAVPAPVCVEVHRAMPADERPYLAASTYSKVVLVACEMDRRLDGGPFYAAIFPRSPDRALSYVAFEHRKTADRAPAGEGLVYAVAAPAVSRDLFDADDATVADTLVGAAGRFFPDAFAAVRKRHVVRWRHALPELAPGALSRRSEFLARPPRAIEYAGDWLVSPSIEGAVRSARLASSRVHGWLSGEPGR